MIKRIPWEQFFQAAINEKIPFLSAADAPAKPFHVLFAQQFDRASLDALFTLTDKIRKIHKTTDGSAFLRSLLADKHALNLFVQPSTRTFLSFQVAEQNLGMATCDIRDVSTSSQAKGETLENTIRTFSSYVELIVMRHPDKGACELAAWEMNMADRRVPVINGGSGRDQHPTQALLDLYTIQKSLGEIDGKTIVMVGDLARGRTVRSLSYLLKNYHDVKIIYVAPKRLAIGEDIKAFLHQVNIPFTETEDLEGVIPAADAVYMTRIQWEWDAAGGMTTGEGKSDPRFVFRADFLKRMKAVSCLLHPLPKINEIAPELDYVEDPRLVYWRQERNGMWTRCALIATIFGKAEEIMRF
ncbi:MAG TPA: aspartate carbamoyltransferase [Candidatus Brocadiia bacterium]|nr:aspartate carbamoyltransferase [Candidatus Brocadiia bacterium]